MQSSAGAEDPQGLAWATRRLTAPADVSRSHCVEVCFDCLILSEDCQLATYSDAEEAHETRCSRLILWMICSRLVL